MDSSVLIRVIRGHMVWARWRHGPGSVRVAENQPLSGGFSPTHWAIFTRTRPVSSSCIRNSWASFFFRSAESFALAAFMTETISDSSSNVGGSGKENAEPSSCSSKRVVGRFATRLKRANRQACGRRPARGPSFRSRLGAGRKPAGLLRPRYRRDAPGGAIASRGS